MALSKQHELHKRRFGRNLGVGLTLVAFPEFARKLHSFKDYKDEFPQRSLSNEALSGVGLCGPVKAVKSLTGSLKLLR